MGTSTDDTAAQHDMDTATQADDRAQTDAIDDDSDRSASGVSTTVEKPGRKFRIPLIPYPTDWVHVTAYALLPALVVLLTIGAGLSKWWVVSKQNSAQERTESVAAAKDAAIALLSYQPENVEKELGDASNQWLTGAFKDSYSQLVHDVVVPGSRQHRISAVAHVPAAASVSASSSHAVALVFLNQSVLVGKEAPSETGSSVRVTLDKVGGRWLVSAFDPV